MDSSERPLHEICGDPSPMSPNETVTCSKTKGHEGYHSDSLGWCKRKIRDHEGCWQAADTSLCCNDCKGAT